MLVSVDMGFLVEVIRLGLSSICSSWICCPLRCLDRCSTVLHSSDFSDCVLVILLFALFLSYFADYGPCSFLFPYTASLTDVRISRCVLDMFTYMLVVEAGFPWIPFLCVRYHCLVRTQ